MPVHDQEAPLAVSEAPRFRSSSEKRTQRTLSASCSRGSRHPEGRFSMGLGEQLVRVPETFQDRIVPRGFEKLQHRAKDFVQDGVRMLHVKSQWIQIAAEMQFRLVVQRTASVTLQALRERPGEDVAERIEIKVKIESHAGVEAARM